MDVLTQQDRREIRDTIRGQLNALGSLDAERALAFCTERRRAHGPPGRFLVAISSAFPQLTQARSAQFGDPQVAEDRCVQPVRVRTWDSSEVDAVFVLCRDEGAWRIDLCVCRPQEQPQQQLLN